MCKEPYQIPITSVFSFDSAGVFHVYEKIVQYIVQASFQIHLAGLGLSGNNARFYW